MDEKLKKIVSLMERDDSVPAPQDAVKWAKDLFRAAVPAVEPSFVKRLIATLQASITPENTAFGERSASPSEERQLLYTAGEIGIHLNVSHTKRSSVVRGQFLTEDLYDQAVVALAGPVTASVGVEDGEFFFASVLHGTYRMTITSAGTEIVIEDLAL